MQTLRRMVRHEVGVTVAALGWSPLDLPNLLAWFDATDAATITASGGDVSQWDDKSGNGYHVAQGTGSQQPSTGVRTIGGGNALDFDHTANQFLSSSASMGATTSTIYMLIEFDGAAGATRLAFDGVSPGGRQGILTNNGAGNVWSGYQDAFIGSSVAATVGIPQVVVVRLAGGAGSRCDVDGVAGTPGGTAANTLQRFRIGGEFNASASNSWNGAIREVFFCSGLSASGDEDDAVDYLMDRGGI